jgi:hypothetical protein
MFENRVPRRMFGLKINEVIRGRRNSIMIIRIMESRRMRWARYAWGEEECIQDIDWKETTRKTKMWVYNIKMDLRQDGVVWTGEGEGPVEGSCGHGNEPLGS